MDEYKPSQNRQVVVVSATYVPTPEAQKDSERVIKYVYVIFKRDLSRDGHRHSERFKICLPFGNVAFQRSTATIRLNAGVFSYYSLFKNLCLEYKISTKNGCTMTGTA
jgi:hypothetical protein